MGSYICARVRSAFQRVVPGWISRAGHNCGLRGSVGRRRLRERTLRKINPLGVRLSVAEQDDRVLRVRIAGHGLLGEQCRLRRIEYGRVVGDALADVHGVDDGVGSAGTRSAVQSNTVWGDGQAADRSSVAAISHRLHDGGTGIQIPRGWGVGLVVVAHKAIGVRIARSVCDLIARRPFGPVWIGVCERRVARDSGSWKGQHLIRQRLNIGCAAASVGHREIRRDDVGECPKADVEVCVRVGAGGLAKLARVDGSQQRLNSLQRALEFRGAAGTVGVGGGHRPRSIFNDGYIPIIRNAIHRRRRLGFDCQRRNAEEPHEECVDGVRLVGVDSVFGRTGSAGFTIRLEQVQANRRDDGRDSARFPQRAAGVRFSGRGTILVSESGCVAAS